MTAQPDRESLWQRAQEALAAGDGRAALSLVRYMLREYPDDPAAQAMLSELQSGRPAAPPPPAAAADEPPSPGQPVAPVARPPSPSQSVATAVQPPTLQAAAIHCQKCGSQNPPAQDRCRQCGANLLPGESLASRLGFLLGGVLCALVLGGLTYLLIRSPELLPDVPVCNPIVLGVGAILGPFAGLWLALRRTPRYVRYAERANRHVKLNPSLALADLSQAAALAPKKERPGLLKRRAQLYEQLGMREDATRDLLAVASGAGAYQGEANAFAGLFGVDEDTYIDSRRSGERQALLDSGRAIALGYCPRCRTAVELSPKLCCQIHPSRKAQAVQLVVPADIEAGKLAVHQELAQQRSARRKRTFSWVVGLAALGLAGFLLFGPNGILNQTPRATHTETPRAPAPTATVSTFADNVFSFDFPSDWPTIGERDVKALLRTSLKAIGTWDYIGGVYTGSVDDCRGCAQIVAVVIHDPSLTGTLTDEQYSRVRAAQESQMGSRLLVHRLTQVGTFPATELVHIGQSESTKLRELIIIPPEPGVAYLFRCSTDIESYDEFEPVFARAIESLQLAGPVPATAPAGQAPSPVTPAAAPPPATGEQLRQWAVSAQASSQYSQSACSAFQASGEPDTPQCGDEITAWAAAEPDTVEWIQLDYTVPVYPVQVNIVQTYNPDQVARVELLDTEGLFHPVYTNQPEALTQCPFTLSIAIDQPNYQAIAVRITIDQSVHQQWNEIDAVELVGFP